MDGANIMPGGRCVDGGVEGVVEVVGVMGVKVLGCGGEGDARRV